MPEEFDFTPTSNDIQFARDIVNLVADEGIWVWKATGLMYQFFHQVKMVQLLNPELLANPKIAEQHNKIVVTMPYVTWKVVPEKFEGAR